MGPGRVLTAAFIPGTLVLVPGSQVLTAPSELQGVELRVCECGSSPCAAASQHRPLGASPSSFASLPAQSLLLLYLGNFKLIISGLVLFKRVVGRKKKRFF